MSICDQSLICWSLAIILKKVYTFPPISSSRAQFLSTAGGEMKSSGRKRGVRTGLVGAGSALLLFLIGSAMAFAGAAPADAQAPSACPQAMSMSAEGTVV